MRKTILGALTFLMMAPLAMAEEVPVQAPTNLVLEDPAVTISHDDGGGADEPDPCEGEDICVCGIVPEYAAGDGPETDIRSLVVTVNNVPYNGGRGHVTVCLRP